MYTTYHLNSAEDISTDILDAIKATYKSRAITIIVEEDDDNLDISDVMKADLDNRLRENGSPYYTAKESISKLNKKYGL